MGRIYYFPKKTQTINWDSAQKMCLYAVIELGLVSPHTVVLFQLKQTAALYQ